MSTAGATTRAGTVLAHLALLVTLLGALLAGCGGSEAEQASLPAADSPRPCDTHPDQDDEYQGFPVDDVPVIDGEVTYTWNGRDNGEYSCSVEIEWPGEPVPAVVQARSMLEEAGFEVVSEDLEDATTPYLSVESPDYRLQVHGLAHYEAAGSTITYEVRGPYVEESYADPDADEPDADLPEGYPTDEVPLVDGRIETAEAGEDYQGWPAYDVVVVVETTFTATSEEAISLLEAAGLELVEPFEPGDGSGQAHLSNAAYDVYVLVSEDKEEERVTATYNVTEIQ